MSVEDTAVVDFVSLDRADHVVLTVSDHLDWTEEQKHLELLQEKINTYCIYVENGQIYDEYPESRDRRPLISVVLFHDPTPRAEGFFNKAKAVLESEGFNFEWKKYNGSNSSDQQQA
jgi:hypothetical protein